MSFTRRFFCVFLMTCSTRLSHNNIYSITLYIPQGYLLPTYEDYNKFNIFMYKFESKAVKWYLQVFYICSNQ